jgi:hypothetical protein
MKKLILEHLREFNEGRKATHTGGNIHTVNPEEKDAPQGFYGDGEDLRAELAIAQNIYRDNKEAFLPKKGEGLYNFELRYKGNDKFQLRGIGNFVGKKQGKNTHTNNLGGYMQFSIMANNDIQVPSIIQYKKVRWPDKTGKKEYVVNPADMAYFKLLAEFPDAVLDFINEPMGSTYIDDKAAQISKEKMSDKAALKKVKKDFEMKLGRRLKPSEWDKYLETGEEPGSKPVAEPTDRSAEISQIEKKMNLLYQMKDAKRIKDKELRKTTINDLKSQLANL